MSRSFNYYDIIILLRGLQWTVLITLVAFAGGSLCGLLVALSRFSGNRALSTCAKYFIEVFQGTPLLMQLFLVYFGFAIFGVHMSAWVAVSLAYTCHAAAFLGDIWRGSLEAVPRGQSESAFALHLSYAARMRYVVLPQALRISLPATVGFLVQLIKGTSLASIVGFTELSRSGQMINNSVYEPLLVYGLVGALYFALCWPLSKYSARLEDKFAQAQR